MDIALLKQLIKRKLSNNHPLSIKEVFMSKLKDKVKAMKYEQPLLAVISVIYFLETMFVGGLFTNPILLVATLIMGVIATTIATIKKEYKWVIFDLLIFLICFGIVYSLY